MCFLTRFLLEPDRTLLQPSSRRLLLIKNPVKGPGLLFAKTAKPRQTSATRRLCWVMRILRARCLLLILSSVLLFHPRDDAALCLPPSPPPQRPCRLLFRPCEASASVSSCVSVIKRSRPGGPVVRCWASSWINCSMNGLRTCQHRQPPTDSGGAPYVTATGVTLFCLMQNVCHLTAVCYFTPSFIIYVLRNICMQTDKHM